MKSTFSDGECFACKSRLCRFAPDDGPHKIRREIELARGERIETFAGACMKLWTIVSGTAAICANLPDGRRQISGIERAGSTICGPMANEERPTWLEALEPVRICEHDFTSLLPELQNNAGFLFAMFGVMHKRLETATHHLTTLGRLDSTERVILFLAETAQSWPGRGPVHLPMSRDEIADYLGLNAETVSRVMSRLRKSGLFKFLSPSEFFVPDMEAVKRRLPVPLTAPTSDLIDATKVMHQTPVTEIAE